MSNSDNALTVRNLDHVSLHVRDLDAAIRFYGETLDLPRIPHPAFPFVVAWFAAGRQELHLVADANRPKGHEPTGHFAVRVDDAYAAGAALRAKGVPITSGPAPRPDGAVQLYFCDPDGNLIEMVSYPD